VVVERAFRRPWEMSHMNPIEPAGGHSGGEVPGAPMGGGDQVVEGDPGNEGNPGDRGNRGDADQPGEPGEPGGVAAPNGEPAASKSARGNTGPSGLLDDANRAIIEALQRDGRLPYGTIADEVGLSEAAVRRRVQRLRESGVIQIVGVTDPLQLGFHRQAMVGVRVEGDVRLVANKLSELEEVDYVVMCAGSFDLLVEVVCEDDDALFRLLNDSVRSIPGVRSTESFVYLKLAKQTYSWGTR
jgi:Lrp/AsnC family transcriptional regulator, regulator for asnA, asnC and gidA